MKSVNKKGLVRLIKSVAPKNIYVYDGSVCVSTEWLVGNFAGRVFFAPSLDEAVTQMCKYLDEHIGSKNIVGDIVTRSGWPDLEKVKKYLNRK